MPSEELRIQIPETFQAALDRLGTLTDEEFVAFLEELRSSDLNDTRSSIATRIASHVEPALAELCVDLLFALYEMMASLGEPASIVAAALDLVDERSRARFDELLSIPIIGLWAKATLLTDEYERLFEGCQVFTDIRPVFDSGEATEEPAAALVTHLLRIDSRSSEPASQYISLSADDLQILKWHVDRAIEKDQALKALLERIGMACLNR